MERARKGFVLAVFISSLLAFTHSAFGQQDVGVRKEINLRTASETLLDAEIEPGQRHRYLLKAENNKSYRVELNPKSASRLTLSILNPDGSALVSNERHWEGNLLGPGDYILELSAQQDDQSRLYGSSRYMIYLYSRNAEAGPAPRVSRPRRGRARRPRRPTRG